MAYLSHKHMIIIIYTPHKPIPLNVSPVLIFTLPFSNLPHSFKALFSGIRASMLEAVIEQLISQWLYWQFRIRSCCYFDKI